MTDSKPIDIRTIDAHIRRRLRELAPLAREYEQLQAAHAALTGNGASAASAAPQRERAPRGANRAAILDAIAGAPGLDFAAIVARTGIPRPTASATLSKLKALGQIERDSAGHYRLRPADDSASPPADQATSPDAGDVPPTARQRSAGRRSRNASRRPASRRSAARSSRRRPAPTASGSSPRRRHEERRAPAGTHKPDRSPEQA